MPIRDLEKRREPLPADTEGPSVDTSAFSQMPQSYADCVAKYFQLAFASIDASPLKRKRSYLKRNLDQDGLLASVEIVYDRDVVVPVTLFPRPNAVRQWSHSRQAQIAGWRSEDDSNKERGAIYGRSVIFDAGSRSKYPVAVPACAMGTGASEADLYLAGYDPTFFFELGKLVTYPNFHSQVLSDGAADLLFGEVGGAKLVAEQITVPAHLDNYRLRWATVSKGTQVRRFLAYSLVDGNGWPRARRLQRTKDGPISHFVRPLHCELHQPKIRQHDELLLPVPLAWSRTREEYRELGYDYDCHEEWCLDDWFPAQPNACWVLREADDSKPLKESFLLMPGSQASDWPVFFIALFAETEPGQLVRELAALYKVSADTALNSPETMQRLNTLYEKVRDFPLDK